jgi:carbonic anhydrase
MATQVNAQVSDRSALSRRTLLRRAAAFVGTASLAPVLSACDIPLISSSAEPMEMPVETPEEALTRLIEGNLRFASGASKPINETAERRVKVAERQRPFATIFSCVDSRVPPELVFDRGLGDLFVIRTAGNVVDSAVMGSLEYGAYELEIPLLLVLGHKKCGAVKATIETLASKGKAEGSIAYLVEAIRPAVEGEKMALVEPTVEGKPAAATAAATAETVASPDPLDPPVAAEANAEANAEDGATETDAAADSTAIAEETEAATDGEAGGAVDTLTETIKRNVALTVKAVSSSPIIAERIRKDRLRVVGALYDLETGVVELTENVPKEFLPQGAEDTEA